MKILCTGGGGLVGKALKRLTFNDWLTNTVLSSFMIVIPLAALFIFKGKAIAEFSHSILFLVWNLYILKEFKNDEIINL